MPNVVRIQLRGAAGLVRAQTTRIPNGEGERDIDGPSRVSCNAELGGALGRLPRPGEPCEVLRVEPEREVGGACHDVGERTGPLDQPGSDEHQSRQAR